MRNFFHYALGSVFLGMMFVFGERVIGVNPVYAVYGGMACIIMLIIHYGETITFYLRGEDYIEEEGENDERE